MPDQTPTLDTRIRELVARAVADAPPAPELDPALEPHHSRRPWWIGGGIALAAAAAAVAIFTFGGQDDKVATVPATEPTVVTVPDTATDIAPQPSTPLTVAPATTALPVPVPAEGAPSVVLTAGPNGVVEHRDAETRALTTEPVAIALGAGDGRVIVQRVSAVDAAGDPAATVPMVLAPDGTLRELFGTADWDGAVTLHDIEVVDGRTLLLFSLSVAMDNPETANETLYVVDLDTEARTEIAPIGGWESGTGRLHLAVSGLIVGERSTEAVTGPLVLAVPGSPAEALLPAISESALGWEESTDCPDCQRAFTVTPDGTMAAWLDGDELVTAELNGTEAGPEQRHTLDPSIPLEIVRDLDTDGTRFVLSYFRTDDAPPPFMFSADDPSGPLSTLPGRAATMAPAPAEATPAEQGLVTGGPEGVVEYRDGEPVTVSDEPVVFAIAVGDGRIIAQHAQGYDRYEYGAPDDVGAAATMPLVIRPDGPARLLWPAALPAYVTIHDVEVVDGRRLLLYTSAERAPQSLEDEAGEIAYVVDLDDPSAAPVEIAQVSGWEYGVDRLTMATTGLIVGEWHVESSHGIALHAVPGSPAADDLPSPADLGLPESGYGDCSDCPLAFAVTPDGSGVAWLHGQRLMLHDVATGTQSRWSSDALGHAIDGTVISDLDVVRDAAGRLIATISFSSGFEGAERSPISFETRRRSIDQVRDLGGLTATFGPQG